MTNKEILLRNLINHEVFGIDYRLQDLQENFQILFQENIFSSDKNSLFYTQLELLRAHAQKLCELSSRLNADDIKILED